MKKYISLIAVFLTVGIAGCKKDYLSLENNPNQPSITTPDLALAAAEVNTAGIVQTNYPQYGVWAGYWTTSGNFVPNAAVNEYQLTTGTFSGVWDALYLNLSNLNTLQNLSAQSPASANYQAIAIILKVYDWEQVVDNFNDAPYTQAFNPKILTPVYDKGSAIYEDLGKQLDAAIALINKSGSAIGPSTSDIVFKGDMTAWKKFANTLKLRLAIHVSTKNPTDALVTDLASTASEGYLDGTTQATANPGYTGSNSGSGISQENPFYGTYGLDVTGNPTFPNTYYRANTYAVTFFKNTNDPRAARYYAPTTGAGIPPINGNTFGDILHNLQNPGTSAVGPGLLVSPKQNAILFSGAESLFLQAEAALKGYLPGNPQTLYQAGITASFESLGLTDAQATAYYTQALNNVGYTSSGSAEAAIITQKWAALLGLFNLEAYNEFRRTGIPALPSSVDPAAIGSTLPTRILYPTSELNTNATNLGAEGTISQFTSKIFWAQ
jgi:Starch-binding associating with outer membrane